MSGHHEPTKLHRVYVDGENVPLPGPAVINNRSIFTTLFLGAKQTRIETSLVEALMQEPDSVKLVRLKVTGKNALDGVIACHVGQELITHPKAHFHIVSKDKGFDSLISYLTGENIRIGRHDGYETLPGTPAQKKTADLDLSTTAMKRLKSHPRIRPTKQKSLVNFLRSNFGKGVTEAHAMKAINHWKKAGKIEVSESGAVSYHF